MAKASKKASAIAVKQEAENLKKKKMAQKKAASESEVRSNSRHLRLHAFFIDACSFIRRRTIAFHPFPS